MTWQGGKAARAVPARSPFAALRPMAGAFDGPTEALDQLALALRDYPSKVRLEIRLIGGADGGDIQRWHLPAGSRTATAKRATTARPDVILVMRPEVLVQIVQGQLAPYEALFAGRMRVGGDFESAKAITQALTDPVATYVAPC